MKSASQPGIFPPPPPSALYQEYRIRPGISGASLRRALLSLPVDSGLVAGLGPTLVQKLGLSIQGHRPFPRLKGAKVRIPSTQTDLWLWLRGKDPGGLFHLAEGLRPRLAPFRLWSLAQSFVFEGGKDLSGFVDGTENPKGSKARKAAFAADGSSFVAVQRWIHDFKKLSAMSARGQDLAIGRRKSDDVEIKKAPPSAHIKRTAQEDFNPEAFVLRRSMPWSEGDQAGLMFVAFGKNLDAYEAQLRRMAGLDDGVVDALFRFTRPVSGSYFWCPPVRSGKLKL